MDAQGRKFAMEAPVPLTPAPERIRLATESKPWKNYWRMLGTVILAFILIDFGISTLIFSLLSGEFLLTALGTFCSLAPLPLLIILHRPKMVHVRLATPDPKGKKYHPLPEGGSLYTPQPTVFQRFITTDDSVLDLPPHRQVWAIFIVVVIIGAVLSVPLLFEETLVAGYVIYLFAVIPLFILGFSIPVFAWWATSSKWLGLPTRRRDAEAWLIAGMASALPALIINSWIFPALLPSFLSENAQLFLSYTVSAPVGEEFFKMLAVCLFLPNIRNARQGFQIGFTVGLGFALIENLTYIMGSSFGGAISLTLTTLVRGIGSIPGHAVWTGVTGFGIGCLANSTDVDKRMRWMLRGLSIRTVDFVENLGIDVDGDGDHSGFDHFRKPLDEVLEEESNSPNSWLLIDPDTGQAVSPDGIEDEGESGTPLVTSVQAEQYRKESGFQILPPSNALFCLILAMLGHAFWNGSSFLVSLLGENIGLSLGVDILLNLSWTAVLITTVLFLATIIMKGVRTLPAS
jgi:RsiW-degrading membrane proteinase PrsW (M82 family)